MIGMRMRQDDLVNLLDAGLVELALEFIAFVDIARIDEHCLLSCLDEDRIPLSDIEHLDRDILALLHRRRLRTSCRRRRI